MPSPSQDSRYHQDSPIFRLRGSRAKALFPYPWEGFGIPNDTLVIANHPLVVTCLSFALDFDASVHVSFSNQFLRLLVDSDLFIPIFTGFYPSYNQL